MKYPAMKQRRNRTASRLTPESPHDPPKPRTDPPHHGVHAPRAKDKDQGCAVTPFHSVQYPEQKHRPPGEYTEKMSEPMESVQTHLLSLRNLTALPRTGLERFVQ